MESSKELSERVVDAIHKSGWHIKEVSVASEINKRNVCIVIELNGYSGKDYCAAIEYDGTDNGFASDVKKKYSDSTLVLSFEQLRAYQNKNSDKDLNSNKIFKTVVSALGRLNNTCVSMKIT